ncbi:MAG: NAD-reducing [NiFe] hydrogenase HoxFUYH(E), subunit delta (HoxY) [Candidatus Bipolaricaulis sibiricus]|uniref:NAD-reducing [NiFe] hydrogenase HoxFUYH(E), subunit delta (HoxY) n=1 Tax=Bipolaricaulis sibiricus TaxID=2501609 RepID=A0A410FUW6_BIPS1|nr:MAG: NAD-reducing [NiFe] hydrogenase HoxFUYH(E), subunit delta (HoxY) [Candidatus Bipolaricaulis sibiricus]
MPKVRLASVWFSGCSGCHMSFLDLDERLLELAAKVDLVYSPIVDIKEYPEDVDVLLVEGAIGNSEQRHLLEEMRGKTKIVVAFGDCAVTGNVPSLRNPIPREELLREVYGEGDIPGLEEGDVPKMLPQALPIHAFVKVDRFIPGCPPSADRIWRFLQALLAGKRPELTGADLKFG